MSAGEDVFSGEYAALYDAFYAGKDYAAECDLVAAAADRLGCGPVRRVLDIGCGTGNHSLELAARGLEVIGLDRSAPMLAEARRKAAARGLALSLVEGDLRDIPASDVPPVDAVLFMFAVLGYQVANADVRAALRGARAALRPGGLLLFDVWYGPAVLSTRPEPRERTVQAGGVEVVRRSNATIDSLRDACRVELAWSFSDPSRGRVERAEVHEMRYFFVPELELLLGDAGFEAVACSAFPSLDAPLDDTTWNVLVAARAAQPA